MCGPDDSLQRALSRSRCIRLVQVQAARAAPPCSSTHTQTTRAKAAKSRALACLIEAQLSTPQEGLRNLALKGRLRSVTQLLSVPCWCAWPSINGNQHLLQATPMAGTAPPLSLQRQGTE